MSAPVMSAMLVLALGIFAWSLWRRWRLMRIGSATDRHGDVGSRIKGLITFVNHEPIGVESSTWVAAVLPVITEQLDRQPDRVGSFLAWMGASISAAPRLLDDHGCGHVAVGFDWGILLRVVCTYAPLGLHIAFRSIFHGDLCQFAAQDHCSIPSRGNRFPFAYLTGGRASLRHYFLQGPTPNAGRFSQEV